MATGFSGCRSRRSLTTPLNHHRLGTSDLILLLGSWGDPYGTEDLIAILANWGPCP